MLSVFGDVFPGGVFVVCGKRGYQGVHPLPAGELSACPLFLSVANDPRRGSSVLSVLKEVSVHVLAEVV